MKSTFILIWKLVCIGFKNGSGQISKEELLYQNAQVFIRSKAATDYDAVKAIKDCLDNKNIPDKKIDELVELFIKERPSATNNLINFSK